MLNFKKTKVAVEKETTGEKLRFSREQKKLTLEEASRTTGINQEYLSALESGNDNLLPGGIYKKNFLKKYSSFLGFNFKQLAIEDGEEKSYEKKRRPDVFAKKITRGREFLVFPKIIRNILIAFSVLALLFYLGFYLENILAKPKLSVYTPADNLITSDNFINVTGQADPRAQVAINGVSTLKNGAGYFEEKIELKRGINEITISAQNKHSQKNIIKKQILVK